MRREGYLPAVGTGCSKTARQQRSKQLIMAGSLRDPCEGEGADGKGGNFWLYESLTPKETGRPWGILGKEVKDHSGGLG